MMAQEREQDAALLLRQKWPQARPSEVFLRYADTRRQKLVFYSNHGLARLNTRRERRLGRRRRGILPDGDEALDHLAGPL